MLRDYARHLTCVVIAVAGFLQITGCSSWFEKDKPQPPESFFGSTAPVKVSDEVKAKTNLELGVRYMELGRYETALQKLQYALDLDSKNSHIHNALGVLYEHIGKREEAREEFEKALSLKPEDTAVLTDYGRFLCDTGDYQQGMGYLKEAANSALNDRKWFAITYAGLCEYGQGNYPVAEEYLRTALQDKPNFGPALLGMIKISYKNGQYLSARAFIERHMANTQPANAEILWYAVQTERQLDNSKQADDYRQRLLKEFPMSPQAKQLKTIN